MVYVCGVCMCGVYVCGVCVGFEAGPHICVPSTLSSSHLKVFSSCDVVLPALNSITDS